jgi:hypothetical protein
VLAKPFSEENAWRDDKNKGLEPAPEDFKGGGKERISNVNKTL